MILAIIIIAAPLHHRVLIYVVLRILFYTVYYCEKERIFFVCRTNDRLDSFVIGNADARGQAVYKYFEVFQEDLKA
jgi:hypothetical protein